MNTRLAILLSCALLATSTQAAVVSSFTETFGGGAYDHAAWTPMNAGTSLSLIGSSTDRDHWDGPNDGGLLIERGVASAGTFGATLSLGTVSDEDVGSYVSVDFAYEMPADGFRDLKPVFTIDGRVIAEGVPVSVFSTGNDPSAGDGLYSSVLVRVTGLLTRLDVDKELFLTIQYVDGNISENRDLLLDAVNFINSGDAVELPEVSSAMSGSGTAAYLDVTYPSRIDKGLPALQYIWNVSDDLTQFSWMGASAKETIRHPVSADYESVTHRFALSPDSPEFYRLSVRHKRLGDPGVTFDEGKMDPDYPQMQEWKKAGVPGGIPFRHDWPVVAVLEPTNSAAINAVLSSVWRNAFKNGGATVLLKNGTYTIDQTVMMTPYVQLLGESRDGVELIVTITSDPDPASDAIPSAILFESIFRSGIANLTIRGGYGTPRQDRMIFRNEKPEFTVDSINFEGAYDCWADDLNIIDSGRHPISSWNARNITIRGCYVDGAWNKGELGRGYFALQGSYFLVVENHVRRLRHFGLQKHYCQYNVVFRNFIEQDINFHDDDLGNNLIEGNRIVLPTTINDTRWHAVMGPWSTVQHSISRKDNYVFNNKCIEFNNGGIEVFSDTGLVYVGARRYEQDGNPFDSTDNVPVGGTFYPVILAPGSGGN
ncbi:MAG TPA: hypothetical protein VK995_01725 [Oceanipulchritudo sp.]|nr:hypothetical protein [Oceanipulchritudo sp.]